MPDLRVRTAGLESGCRGLRDPEVDDLRHRPPIALGHEQVRGFEVTVDDALVMRVLHAVADFEEQRQALAQIEALRVAVRGEWHARHVLHREVRPPLLCRPGIEDLRDARMTHDGERLTLRLEPRDDFAAVHAQLDDLEGHAAYDRRGLLGEIDLPDRAFSNGLEHFVWADLTAGERRRWHVCRDATPGFRLIVRVQ